MANCLVNCQKDEQGSFILFVACVLPIASLITILAVDVSQFQAMRSLAQKQADRIALEAAKRLPDIVGVNDVIFREVDTIPGLDLLSQETVVSSDRVQVVLTATSTSVFDIFSPERTLFRVQERAEVTVVPEDVLVVLSDGRSLRPAQYESWGEERLWPASGYFRFVNTPPDNEFADGASSNSTQEWWKEPWEEGRYQRWATQACFNPIYSSLKLATIAVLDTFSVYQSNRVGVLFSPGEDVRRGFSTGSNLSFESLGDGMPHGNWNDYFDSSTYIGDEACALFANAEEDNDDRYQIPGLSRFADLQRERSCSPFEQSTLGGSYYPREVLEECWRNTLLSAQEAVYYHAVRASDHDVDGQSLVSALERAVFELTNAHADETARRGNLKHQTLKKVVVLSDFLPNTATDSFANLLTRAEVSGVVLLFAPLLHEYMEPSQRAIQEERLERLLAESSSSIRVYPSRTPEDLLAITLPRVLVMKREFAIRS